MRRGWIGLVASAVAWAALLGPGGLVPSACADTASPFWGRGRAREAWEGPYAEGLGHLAGARILSLELSFAPRVLRERERLIEQIDQLAIAALASFEEALSSAPDDPLLHYAAFVAASTYLNDENREGTRYSVRTEKFEAVLRHARALARLAPQHSQQYMIEEAFVTALAKLGAATRGSRALELFGQAADAYEIHLARQDDAAMFAVRRDSSYTNAAEIYMAAGRLGEALALYRRAVELGPTQPFNHYGLALALDRTGEAESALAAMREALRLDSKGELAHADERGASVYFVPTGDKHAYQALAYQAQGRKAEAQAAWTRFLAEAVDAQPEYRARARQHLARLRGGTRRAPTPVRAPDGQR